MGSQADVRAPSALEERPPRGPASRLGAQQRGLKAKAQFHEGQGARGGKGRKTVSLVSIS